MTSLTGRRVAAGAAGLVLLGFALSLYCHLAATRAPRAPAQSRALALSWGSFATTNIDLAALNGDHTLSVRFMAAYEASYRGVVVADESGSYHLGMAPYASLGRPALELCVGGDTFTHPLGDATLTDNDFRKGPPRKPSRRWRHVALSRRGTSVVVAYDGHVVGAFEAGDRAATGRLRLGRLAKPVYGTQDQFYGLIDDLRLWRVGLDELALERLTADADAGVTPSAQLDFDAPLGAAPASLSLAGAARLSPVSREHRGTLDEPRLPLPHHETRLELPFSPGQVWMTIQGVDSALSHHDVAAFAIDLIRVDPTFVDHNPRQLPGGSHHASEGQPVLAPAPGRIAVVVDGRNGSSKTTPAASNVVCVEHAEREVSCVLHVMAGAEAREAAWVERGEVLARVGSSGAATVHLHFALSDLPESRSTEVESRLVTIPAAFSNYQVSTNFGRSWHHVERGVPAPGEWVRRVAEPVIVPR